MQPTTQPVTRSAQTSTYYVFGEDLASALVGPFASPAEAEAHIRFCEARGDGARMEVVSDFIAARLDPKAVNMQYTPEEDRNYKM